MATGFFGHRMDGNNRHERNDCLYIAFRGKRAVPGRSAAWTARTWNVFQRSLEPLGDELIKQIPASGN